MHFSPDMFKLISISIISFFILIPAKVFPQQAWTGIAVKSVFGEKWPVKTEIQQRADLSPYKTDNLFSETDIGYMIRPSLELRGTYRHRFLPSDARSINRLSSSLIWQPNNNNSRTEITGRILYQRNFREENTFRDAIRLLAEIGYDLGAGKPYISVESFHQPVKPYQMNRLRSTFGVKGDLSEIFQIVLFYRRDDYFNQPEGHEMTNYIFGLSGIFKVNRRVKETQDSADQ